MGKVLVQMAADEDSEAVVMGNAVLEWPALPAKAREEESAEAITASTVPAIMKEPAAKPVFFCKCAHLFALTCLILHHLPALCKGDLPLFWSRINTVLMILLCCAGQTGRTSLREGWEALGWRWQCG
jgi:hypothetical protein